MKSPTILNWSEPAPHTLPVDPPRPQAAAARRPYLRWQEDERFLSLAYSNRLATPDYPCHGAVFVTVMMVRGRASEPQTALNPKA